MGVPFPAGVTGSTGALLLLATAPWSSQGLGRGGGDQGGASPAGERLFAALGFRKVAGLGPPPAFLAGAASSALARPRRVASLLRSSGTSLPPSIPRAGGWVPAIVGRGGGRLLQGPRPSSVHPESPAGSVWEHPRPLCSLLLCRSCGFGPLRPRWSPFSGGLSRGFPTGMGTPLSPIAHPGLMAAPGLQTRFGPSLRGAPDAAGGEEPLINGIGPADWSIRLKYRRKREPPLARRTCT